MEGGWERVHGETEDARNRLSAGLADPDEFFADRGFALDCHESDGEWWCDLTKPTHENVAARYGRGSSAADAKAHAVQRWVVEQEPADLRRRPGEPLP